MIGVMKDYWTCTIGWFSNRKQVDEAIDENYVSIIETPYLDNYVIRTYRFDVSLSWKCEVYRMCGAKEFSPIESPIVHEDWHAALMAARSYFSAIDLSNAAEPEEVEIT